LVCAVGYSFSKQSSRLLWIYVVYHSEVASFPRNRACFDLLFIACCGVETVTVSGMMHIMWTKPSQSVSPQRSAHRHSQALSMLKCAQPVNIKSRPIFPSPHSYRKRTMYNNCMKSMEKYILLLVNTGHRDLVGVFFEIGISVVHSL
jgi:hypothetical protein